MGNSHVPVQPIVANHRCHACLRAVFLTGPNAADRCGRAGQDRRTGRFADRRLRARPEAAFPARLEAALRAKGIAVEIANAGVSGDTASGGLARLDWSVPDGTDAVILELGANDALARRRSERHARRARRDLAPAQGAPHRRCCSPACARRATWAPTMCGRSMRSSRTWRRPTMSCSTRSSSTGSWGTARSTRGTGSTRPPPGIDVIVERILPKAEELIARVKANGD